MSKNNHNLALRSFDSIEAGLVLPEISFIIDSSQIFMFSAITWNRHRIHYDHHAALGEGYDGVIIQRGLLGNIFTRYADTVFSGCFVSSVNWKVLSSVQSNQEIRCKGIVKDVRSTTNGQFVDITMSLTNGDIVFCESDAGIRTIKDSDVKLPV